MKITIEISLGNDAMQTPDDVADALNKVAAQVRRYANPADLDGIRVKDLNGNTVGRVTVEDDE